MSRVHFTENGPHPARRSSIARLTAWIEELSRKSYASWALFAIACVEGSCFPLPPDPLFIAMCLGNPRRSFRFAFICAAGSVAGSLLGYGIGVAFFESIGKPLLSGLGASEAFNAILLQYQEHGAMTLVLAGFTPVPYAVVTIAAGFNQTLSLETLLLGSLVGRSIRFGLLGGLLYAFGEPVKRFLATHRIALLAAMLALVIASVLLARWLF